MTHGRKQFFYRIPSIDHYVFIESNKKDGCIFIKYHQWITEVLQKILT